MKNLQLGKVVMTAGIASHMDEANFFKEVMDNLDRHANGDWGCLSEEDKLANDNALNNNESDGLYIVDDTYQEGGEKGLHFYDWDTILHQIKWSNRSPDPRYLKDYRMTVHYEHGLFFEFQRKG